MIGTAIIIEETEVITAGDCVVSGFCYKENKRI